MEGMEMSGKMSEQGLLNLIKGVRARGALATMQVASASAASYRAFRERQREIRSPHGVGQQSNLVEYLKKIFEFIGLREGPAHTTWG
jgi:hypothetical protein